MNTALNSGGAAYVAKTLVDQLSTNVEIDIKLLHGQNNKVIGNYHGVQYEYLRYINAGLFRLFGTPRFGVYSSNVNKLIEGADVLHFHNLHGYWINYFKVFYKLNKPTVWTWHDMWPLTGRCGFNMKCDLWLNGCLKCKHKDYYPSSIGNATYLEHQRKMKFLRNDKLVVVTPSKWLAKNAISSNFINHNKIKVISNPVNTHLFNIKSKKDCQAMLGLETEKPIMLFVANNCNDERKGYRDFEIATKLLDVTGLIVGDPPNVKSGNIIYLGKLTDRSILSLCYSAADCFVIPTYEDNFPNTVLESMASGTPVFGYKTGGVPEQVPPDWKGLVDVGDTMLLVKRIQKFLDRNNSEKLLIKSKMRVWAEKNSSLESVCDQYHALYRMMVK